MARLAFAVALVTVLATACVAASPPATLVESPPAAPAPPPGPVVEVFPARTTPPLDPNANPTTPLGELRARYLPVWSRDFDWAFPPETCGSDWALDAIAEPTSGASLAVLRDPIAAAALSVMRYEYLLSRALAEPDVLEQLCIAVATVGPARSESLDLLASYLEAGGRSSKPAAYPDAVTIVAASPTVALGVACLTPGDPGFAPGDGAAADTSSRDTRLAAYLLAVSRGLEDAVTDISYRVSNVTATPAEGCEELESWVGQWTSQAQDWEASGEIWGIVGRTASAGEICASRRADGSGDCPQDWAS